MTALGFRITLFVLNKSDNHNYNLYSNYKNPEGLSLPGLHYSAYSSSKVKISPVFSFFTTFTLATLIRDWYLSFLGPLLE